LRRRLPFICAILILPTVASAQISFTALDLASQSKLLFQATSRSPDFGTYSTLFLANLSTKGLRQLTFFPEEVLLLKNKEVIQIQNRYGVFRSDSDFKNISPIPLFPAFVTGSQIQSGKIAPMQTSPNGRYLLFLRQRSAAYGDLTLFDLNRGTQTVIAEHVEISLNEPPAQWSLDSLFVVFTKASGLYYFSLAQLDQDRVLAESLRRIGDGRIANIKWGVNGTLYYISGSVIYGIDPTQLFTRALYAGFLSIGQVMGSIPFNFDPNFDSFWVAPDSKRLLLDKGGQNIFLFKLMSGDFHDAAGPTALPYLYLPRDTVLKKVLWSSGNTLTLFCETWRSGTKGSTLFRLSPDSEGRFGSFQQLTDVGIRDVSLSPNGSRVALMRDNDVVWKEYATWKTAGNAYHPSPLHVVWLSDEELLIAGTWIIERYTIASGAASLVALSQVGKSGYARDGTTILAGASTLTYSFNEAVGGWKQATTVLIRDPSLVSDSYRVYTETSTRGSYENLVMARDNKGFGTAAVSPPETAVFEAYPASDQAADFSNFAHGSRIRRREVGLVFNAISSPEGLTQILSTLSAYGAKCTFFINGEFIRRYPEAVREIAQSGHEVGSLFTTYFNMTDERFRVDAAFVKTGLARNEDDYFAAADKELSLFWHAPYYLVNSDIIDAARSMNYTYVGRDVESYDWAAKTDNNRELGIYLSASDIVDKIVTEKKPGSIVPILVGPGEGARDDYLFQKLDILVNELIRLGYDIVPVSTLIEHAR
jgi:peptidoglycan/xylan/chitin deacetylase (PgdA/CDA1 family)